MTVVDDILAKVTPVTRRPEVCLDAALAARIDDLERDLLAAAEDDARYNRQPQAPKIARQIAQLEEAQRASMQVFEVRSVGSTAWTTLRGQHPPTKAQRSDGWDVNPDTFRPAAIAACCHLVVIDGDTEELVPLTVADAERLAATLSEGQLRRIWQDVLWCNTEGDTRPKSVTATGLLALSEIASTSPAPTASP